ncbi:hypothetical protein [Novosphingobium sp. MMS21-SN21R]|uniref:hypothetical protein n=1 Tax=Novosphingobium sp. MMS21-SN21R TaxID=2969298 RepID=UPI002887C834|nr:hypothetical protein [Novosphingobium sp. MMS21-SN21R]MDT0506716.1 hypothetical protein [Novosphingobium sp. MMS21-SN21R]
MGINPVFAIVLSSIGGFIVLGPLMLLLRVTSISRFLSESYMAGKAPLYSFAAFWLGGTERAIATTLMIFAPEQLALFIGGWTAAKIAAGWSRLQGAEYTVGHLTALIGSAWSFAIAIGIGAWANPDSVRVFLATTK